MGFFDDLRASNELGRLHKKLDTRYRGIPKYKHFDDAGTGYGERLGLDKWFESSAFKNLSYERKMEVCLELLESDDHAANKLHCYNALEIFNPSYFKNPSDSFLQKKRMYQATTKKCEYCFEEIKKDATKCRYCMEFLTL